MRIYFDLIWFILVCLSVGRFAYGGVTGMDFFSNIESVQIQSVDISGVNKGIDVIVYMYKYKASR